MWKSIAFVSSGLTLVAFIIAAAVWIYRKWLLQKERLIRQAPEGERAKLVENALEFFNVNTAGLTKEQQYRIAIRQIHDRTLRFRITAFVIVIIAFLATGISIFALLRESSGERPVNPTLTSIPATTNTPTLTPHPTPPLTPPPIANAPSPIPKPSEPPSSSDDEMVSEGVHRNNMQACPPGYAIGGAWLRRTSPSTFLCRRVISRGDERYEVTVEDHETQRNGIHACPLGMYMIGVHLGNSVWLCGYDSRRGIRQTEEFLDGPPVSSPSLDKGMHACPSTPGRIGYLAGIYETDNRFLCGEYHP